MSNSDPNELPPTEDLSPVDPKRNNNRPVSEYPVVPPKKGGWLILAGFIAIVASVIGLIVWGVYGYKPKPPGSSEVPQSVTVSAKKEFRCGEFVTERCESVDIASLPSVAKEESSSKKGPLLDCSSGAKPILNEAGVLVAINVCECACKE